MPDLKAVFFDLDDTLCDDASAWIKCARKAAGIATEYDPRVDADVLASIFFGISERYWFSEAATRETRPILDVREEHWRDALAAIGRPDLAPQLAQAVASDYGRRRSTEIDLFPDAIPTLEALRAAGLCLALITNGLQMTHIEKIEQLGLEPHFDHVIIADAFGHFKPDPRIFQHALALCGCTPGEAVMVGDNLISDIGGAEAAGIRSYWHNPGGMSLPSDAPVPAGGEIRLLGEILALLGIPQTFVDVSAI